MSDTRELIRLDKAVRHAAMTHSPYQIYVECGHEHTEEEAGVFYIDEVGLVCEDGNQYTICGQCCTDNGDNYQTEECATKHQEKADHACWPCPRLVSAARELGIEVRS